MEKTRPKVNLCHSSTWLSTMLFWVWVGCGLLHCQRQWPTDRRLPWYQSCCVSKPGQNVPRRDPLLLSFSDSTEWRFRPVIVVCIRNGSAKQCLSTGSSCQSQQSCVCVSYILVVYVMKSHFIIHHFLRFWDFRQDWVWKRPCGSFPKILKAWFLIYI